MRKVHWRFVVSISGHLVKACANDAIHVRVEELVALREKITGSLVISCVDENE